MNGINFYGLKDWRSHVFKYPFSTDTQGTYLSVTSLVIGVTVSLFVFGMTPYAAPSILVFPPLLLALYASFYFLSSYFYKLRA